jgi:hypothetical protein
MEHRVKGQKQIAAGSGQQAAWQERQKDGFSDLNESGKAG